MTKPARRPITPTRVIPAAQPLPAPASPPPAPPAIPPEPPDWWRPGSGPSGPPPPVPVDVHVHITLDQGGPLSVPDPEPGPRWWQRARIGYNLALAALSLGVAGPWAKLLSTVREEASLAAAWVVALIPLVVLGFLDNARRVEEEGADPRLWKPKVRAALARFALWAAAIGTALALPVTTLVYIATGVRT